MKNLILVSLLAINVFGKSYDNYLQPKIETISWDNDKKITLYCIKGYVFIYTWRNGAGTTQFLIERDGKTVPMPCTDLKD